MMLTTFVVVCDFFQDTKRHRPDVTCNLPGQKVVASFSSHFLGELLSLFAKTSFHFGPLCPLQTSLISFPALIFDYKAKQKCLEFDPFFSGNALLRAQNKKY